jgi:hypothetical protein
VGDNSIPMEGLMKSVLAPIFILVIGMTSSFGQSTKPSIYYFNQMFGHILETPQPNAASVSTIPCQFPLRMSTTQSENDLWHRVEAQDLKGFVLKEYLSSSKVDCFQEKYPKFFEQLNLDVSEMYYWGRLYQNFSLGKSEVQ